MTRPAVSFEFFPPKNLEGSFRLWDCVQALAPMAPEFVSVTYGAGGTTRQLTHEAVATIHKTSGLRVAAHLTCVDATREETLEIARGYAEAGVAEIVALRGDPPKGSGGFVAHPDAASPLADVEHLKRKIDAGAHSAITQFFFEADTFFRFRDACAKAGIDAPIIPGILPIENWKGAQKFAGLCGTHIPQVVSDAFEHATRDGNCDLLATALATELCDDLLRGGVEHLHFYTLNKPDLTRDVCNALGIAPKPALQQVA